MRESLVKTVTYMRKNVFILLFLMVSTSCSLLPERDFYMQMDPEYEQKPFFAARDDFEVVGGDPANGYRTYSEQVSRTPASLAQRQDMAFGQSLNEEYRYWIGRQTEASLAHYKKYQHLLSDVTEKIYFLKMTSPEQRENYLISIGRLKLQGAEHNEILNTMRGDVAVGMSKYQVKKMWGSPVRIDVAGNPAWENERWIFTRDGQTRMIYFENGQVEGWKTL